jgi:hypothetical protein
MQTIVKETERSLGIEKQSTIHILLVMNLLLMSNQEVKCYTTENYSGTD